MYGTDQVLYDVDRHQKLKIAAIKRKLYCYEDVHHSMIHVSENFQTNILISYLKNRIFPNNIFYIEILSLSTRDGHIKSLILTKVFHTG